MDPLSATASAIGIAAGVIKAIQALTQTIDEIKNAPEELRHVKGDLGALEPMLRGVKTTLEQKLQNAEQPRTRFDKIVPALENCQHVCDMFQKHLDRWFKKSLNPDKPRNKDNMSYVFRYRKQVQSLSTQLSGCKETLTLVLVADRFIEVPETESLQVLESRFEQLMVAMETNQRQLAELNRSQQDPDEEESIKELLQELRNQVDLSENLRGLCTEAITRLNDTLPSKGTREEQMAKLSEQLKLTNPRNDRRKLIRSKQERVHDTFEWLLAHETYKSWLQGNPPFLWLSGGPGKGKTMLSTFLSEKLEEFVAQKDDNTHLIYYFCSLEDEKRNSAAAVLRGLLWQLTLNPAFRERMAKHVAAQDRLLISEPESLWKLFLAIMEDLGSGKIYCVLDGLDECDEESGLWLAKKLLKLFHPGVSEPELNVLRLILVSRDIPDFKLRGQSVRLSLDSEVHKEIDADIGRVVADRIKNVPGWNDFSDDFKDQVHREIVQRAEGSFLDVDLIMKEISLESTGTAVIETLQSLPQGSPALYSRMLLRIEESRRQESSDLLHWVAMALRPLSLKELANAIGSSIQGNSYTSLDQVAMDTKVRSCGDLLTVNDGVVSLSHAVARDFLLRRQGDEADVLEQFEPHEREILEQFRIEPTQVHLEIALRCLQLIKASHLQHKVLEEPPDDWDGSPLLQYAVLYWPLHARNAGDAGRALFVSPSFVLTSQPSLAKNWWATYVSHRKGEEWEQGKVLSPLHIACRFGIVEWVRAILSNGDKSFIRRMVNQIDINGLSPLAWTAVSGHEDVAVLLLDAGANIDGFTDLWTREGLNSFTPDTFMSFKGELSVGASIWPRQLTALHRAAYMGHEDVVRVLLDRGADFGAKGWLRCTPMHAAAIGGSPEIIRLLLKAGAKRDVNSELKAIHTSPLHYAAQYGNTDAARLLIENGADVRKRQRMSLSTVLYFVPEKDANPATVELLLQSGADVNARDAHYRRPLHYFVMKHAQPAAIKVLLDGGADINSRNSQGHSPLDLAIECRCERCQSTVSMLLAHGGALKSPSETGRAVHPGLFMPDSIEPLPGFTSPSLGSDEADDNTSRHPSIMEAEQSSTGDGSVIDGELLKSLEDVSTKDSILDRSAVVSEVDGDDASAVRKRSRMKAWVKRKLH